jgi:hypothetical protein
LAISTVRETRNPTPIDTSPASSLARAGLMMVFMAPLPVMRLFHAIKAGGGPHVKTERCR